MRLGTQGGLGEEADGAVGPGGEDPRLGGVEGHVQNAQVSGQRVPPQHLHRHQQWVLQQITVGEGRGTRVREAQPPGREGGGGGVQVQHSLVHHPVADDDAPVVGARGEERVPGMEGHGPQGLLVVPAGRGLGEGKLGQGRDRPAPTSAQAPHLSTLYGSLERSRSNHTSLLS